MIATERLKRYRQGWDAFSLNESPRPWAKSAGGLRYMPVLASRFEWAYRTRTCRLSHVLRPKTHAHLDHVVCLKLALFEATRVWRSRLLRLAGRVRPPACLEYPHETSPE
jgi:hypothetical protein